MHRLGEDDHGVWLWAPAGTSLRRGTEHEERSTRPFVKLITPDAWWTGIWTQTGRIYVDVSTPARWEGTTVHLVDMDLDVVRHPDGTVTVEDEDEFEDHRTRFAYPGEVVDRTRAVTARLAMDVERGVDPFGSVGWKWLKSLP